MKIGLSTTSIEPERNSGMLDGLGHYTLQLRQGLRAAGHDVVGYSFSPKLGRKHVKEGRPMPAPFSVMAAAALAGLPRFRPGCDLFHSTDFKVVPMRVPVVVTVWDVVPLLHPEWLSGRIRTLAPWIIRRMVPRADHVITGTQFGARQIAASLGIAESRISVVPWGIESHWLDPVPAATAEAVQRKYGLKPGYFLSVGTIQPRKNIETLLDAWRLLPAATREEHPLVIVGRYGWGSASLRAKLHEAVAADGVIWLQSVKEHAEVRALYAGAHVYVFPSLHEGFGLPLVEAFASKVPVVASNLTSLPEVSGGAALEVDPLDAAAMADAMRMLAEDARLRADHVGRGYKRASELSISSAVAATVSVYEKVVAAGRAR